MAEVRVAERLWTSMYLCTQLHGRLGDISCVLPQMGTSSTHTHQRQWRQQILSAVSCHWRGKRKNQLPSSCSHSLTNVNISQRNIQRPASITYCQ
jgi:hypothetical protein